MYAVHLTADAGAAAFRDVAKRALALGIAPFDLTFVTDERASLFAALPDGPQPSGFTVPRAYAELLQDVICHRAPDRFALLYDVLWRLKHGEPELLSRASDPAIAKLALYAKAIHRDIHKMHAFLRFHAKRTDDGEMYLAWFEPEHFILRRATPFFAERFAQMRWVIATPIGTAIWNGEDLQFDKPQPKPEGMEDAVLDGLWRTYYRTIFNPARVNTQMMTREMPRKYWRNMPETALIPELVAGARERVHGMDREVDIAPRFAARVAAREKPTAPPANDLDALRLQAAGCNACPLHQHATQTVFGEGPPRARLMFVGEQPGDLEDLSGKPFVGPAGQLFDRALKEAGIERSRVYITNAVKHFKFQLRGKRRIHSKPSAGEVQVCRHWLRREMDIVQPDLVVALGGTATLALSGAVVSVTKLRGRPVAWDDGRTGLITVHPSYLLRLPGKAAQAAEYVKFVADLRTAALFVRKAKPEIAGAEAA